MKLRTQINPPLPPDSGGDALADCYKFLLRRLAEKRDVPAEFSAQDTDLQAEGANASREQEPVST